MPLGHRFSSSRGPRILPAEDEAVAAAVTSAFRKSGVEIHERFGAITSFDKTPAGVRMNFINNAGHTDGAEAALAVVAAGWAADTAALNLAKVGVEIDARGNIKVDRFLRTSTPHIFAAGDVTGRLMLVPGAIEDGFVAATNAVRGAIQPLPQRVSPSGSFTHPEYAQVGLTEAKARQTHDVVTTVVHFDATVRAINEGRTFGFCKLVTDRESNRILGCHVVGERAVEVAQLAQLQWRPEWLWMNWRVSPFPFQLMQRYSCRRLVRAAVALNLPLAGHAEHVGLAAVSACNSADPTARSESTSISQ